MTKGTAIGLGIGAVVLIGVGGLAIFASGVAKEASTMDAAMKADLSQHLTMPEVKQQLAGDSYTLGQSGGQSGGQGGAELDASGPDHSFVVYSTHLTLKLTFDSDGKLTGYHLDRA